MPQRNENIEYSFEFKKYQNTNRKRQKFSEIDICENSGVSI
jgi:hypothetical protein